MTDIQKHLRQIDRRLGQTEVVEKPMGVGATFPTGVAAGYLFFRTDLGFLCYYDGAHWLTMHEYEADLTPYTAGSTARITVTNTTVLIQPVRTDYDKNPTRIKLYCDVLTTNNGSNYWTFNIGTDTTTSWSPSTAADSAGVGINKENAIGTIVTGDFWKAGVTKTGTPGGIVFNVTIYYRLVIT